MIRRAMLILLMITVSAYGASQKKVVETRDVMHVATALNHLTVFEFGEQVTNAAVGSNAFQVEWKENRVYVKPLKTGASTDLFIWTSSQRFDYELQAPGDVKDMSFVIANPAPTAAPPAVQTSGVQADEMADMILARAMLGLDAVDHSDIKEMKHGVTVRIENVFESKTTTYIRYSILNLGDRPYRVLTPTVTRIVADHPDFSLITRRNIQLDQNHVRHLGPTQRTALSATKGESRLMDLKPGDHTEGVVIIRSTMAGLRVLELSFGSYADNPVNAVFVF